MVGVQGWPAVSEGEGRPAAEAALLQAGATLRDVVRVLYVLPKADEFPECWPILRKYFGDIRPAAMMISAGLYDPRMRIEIEVTALKQSKA